MSHRTNKQVYATDAFEEWADHDGLSQQERYLIERYLAKPGPTLEAGTGGGRILRAMLEEGYESLHGFDFVPEMIDAAHANDTTGDIRFDVEDATGLSYEDASFAQVVYLQQVICFIESAEGRLDAMHEALRVLQDGGVAVFSFLSWDARLKRPLYRTLGTMLRVQRRLRRRSMHPHDQPWLRVGGRLHAGALIDRGPYVHWFTLDEAQSLLVEAGFEVSAAGFFDSIPPDSTSPGDEGGGPDAIYVVGRKPGSTVE